MVNRIPSATFIAVATLKKHILKFNKVSHKDGSGKCDALETNNQNDKVLGVVFDISESEKTDLDWYEGLYNGYEEKTVQVNSITGELMEAVTYYATNCDSQLKPYHWYKEHVLRGANENGLPEVYIQSFVEVESITDPIPERHEKELQIYR